MADPASVLYVGVDIGGTSVKVGVVDVNGKVLAREQQQFLPDAREPSDVVAVTSTLVEKLLAGMELDVKAVAGVGAGCPGVIKADGTVDGAANFSSWRSAPLQQMLADKLGVPVRLCNDADAAILAEQWVGTANGAKNFIMLTLGTGVGFGIICNGEIVRGGTGAIEGGHLIVERNGRLCGCSQRGCLESYSSASGLLNQVQEQLQAGAESSLGSYAPEDINVKLLFDQAAAGDTLCKRLIDEATDYLGFGCVSFCRILDPELIVLSGGIAEAGESLLESIRAAYYKYSWTRLPNPVRIEKASAGYNSGIIGAAAVWR